MPRSILTGFALALLFSPQLATAADALTKEQATAALHKAIDFFRTKVGVQGGYIYRTSEDLAKREGENKVTATQAWVQPPSTPAVGQAYLSVYQLTGDKQCLDASRETAECLIRCQLASGCWADMLELDPSARKKHAYRVDGGLVGKQQNTSTLDDDKSQSCIRFLMRLDQELKFVDKPLHDTTRLALDTLVAVQYPNGAWPQRFNGPPDDAKFPVKKASYPETWSRKWPGSDYKSYYTFNDDTIADVIGVLLEAARTYQEPRYEAAAKRGGDFILLAQMPAPQPAWAQQYDVDMHPAWARKFEPPAITGSESQSLLRVLMALYRQTGDKRYLEPIPAALAYLKSSQLPTGLLARFNELQTNRPLYFTKEYVLTYSDDDLPTHYGFKVNSKLPAIEAEYQKTLAANVPQVLKPSKPDRPKMSKSLTQQAQAVIDALDARGAWVENGTLRDQGKDDTTTRIIDSKTFAKNLGILGQFIAAE